MRTYEICQTGWLQVLFTEDLQTGREIDGIRIVNPFP